MKMPEAKDLLWPVIVGICLIGYQSWTDSEKHQAARINDLPTKSWMRSQFASKDDVQNYAWRLTQLESEAKQSDGRQRNMKDIINRLCQIHDLACSTQNALWRPPMPYPKPRQAEVRVAYHKAPALGVHLVTDDAGA